MNTQIKKASVGTTSKQFFESQMAETVKKSRIVSEDDLEESLMQEFNMRLKHCLSQEKVQSTNADEEREYYEDINNEIIYDVPKVSSGGNPENETQESIYEEVSSVPAKISNGMENGHEAIYENVREVNPVLIVEDEETDESKQQRTSSEEAKTARDRMLLSTDDTSCLLFTQTVTSPMLTPSEENIDFLKGFRAENSDSGSSSKNDDNTQENVSERLLLGEEEQNTDPDVSEAAVAATEPIYENVAEATKQPIFTHGRVDIKAQCQMFIDNEISQEEATQSSDLSPADDSNKQPFLEHPIPDVCLEATLKEKVVDTERNDEEIRSDSTETETIESDVQEELFTDETKELQEEISQNQTEEVQPVETTDDDDIIEIPIRELNEVSFGDKLLNVEDVDLVDNEEFAVDNPSRLVDAIKTKYLSNATGDVAKVLQSSVDKTELMELRTVDIMKHINKFENKSPGSEEGDADDLEESTETTETTYMETTTSIESSSSGVQDKSLKKKKSKKSRSHDKENISVNEVDTNTKDTEVYRYNVNVKNLCRSFGDLTGVGVPEKIQSPRDRSSSVGNVDPGAPLKSLENVFRGVSRQIFLIGQSTNTGTVEKETTTSPKSSFNKFDALQKKNVLHVRSSDSSKAQEKFNGAQSADTSNCKSCGKVVFQMEQIKAERSVWHKNCFRCQECGKQLTVDTYQSNEGTVYCKPHFKSLFAPKAVEDEQQPVPKKHELIISENQPLELPPDVVRASDKPDLGLEELQSLNVRERFQVFENFQEEAGATEKNAGTVNVKRSPSILSKLAKFQAKGMDVGVPVESLNGIPIDESSSEEEPQVEEDGIEGEDADLIRAKRVQKEKPFHFTGMSDVKNKWEHGEQSSKDERREERKQEIQTIRNRLFMGKQGKMKEAYQQAVMESESGTNIKRPTTPPPVEICATKSIKEKFEKGEVYNEENKKEMEEDMSVFESGISKKSRSIFLELDATAAKAPQVSPVSPPTKQQVEVKKVREAYMARQASQDTVKSSEQIDDVKVETSDIQQRFKFFEAYQEPEKVRKQFRITPPRDGQQKAETPEREIYHDPDIVRAEEQVEDSVIAKETHTTTKVLNKFRQMEENLNKEPLNLGPKPLKRFTPPPEPARPESSSEAEGSESEGDESEELEDVDGKLQDADLIEAQKAARARQLRAKFEKWEAKEIKREQQQVNIIEECGDQQGQIESTKVLRAKFESLKDNQNEVNRQPKVKVNRFVDTTSTLEPCDGCKCRIYPLEKISVHNLNYHKKCFKCTECGAVLRMDSYTYNQGKLYCIPHFKQLFISKGNYDTAFGVEQHKKKWNTTVT